MIVSMNVSRSVKICQVLTILHQLICRGVANFGTRCRRHSKIAYIRQVASAWQAVSRVDSAAARRLARVRHLCTHRDRHTKITRLNPFARSWFYNATAVRGALWWLCQCQRKLRKSSTFAIRQAAARLSPGGGTTLQTPFSPVSFGKSFMKIRSVVPKNGCLIFFADGKKTKTKHL